MDLKTSEWPNQRHLAPSGHCVVWRPGLRQRYARRLHQARLLPGLDPQEEDGVVFKVLAAVALSNARLSLKN